MHAARDVAVRILTFEMVESVLTAKSFLGNSTALTQG